MKYWEIIADNLKKAVKTFREFVQRFTHKVTDWFRTLRLVRCLSEDEAIVWVSVITRPLSPQNKDFPKLNDYRGLQGIFETRAAATLQWHFVWTTEAGASQYEADLVDLFGVASSPIARYAIRSATSRKVPLWRRLTILAFATGFLASLAAIVTNIDQINNFLLEWRHIPEMTVETTDTLHVAADRQESKKVTLRGDPFFRARLSDLSMEIEPEPNSGGTKRSVDEGKIRIPTQRSVDVGNDLELNLPFNKLRPGHYLVSLHGTLHTAWRDADFATTHPLNLDVRSPYSGTKGKIQPWPPDVSALDGRCGEALIEIRLLFGRPPKPALNLRISLDGPWTRWDILDVPAEATIERLSQNSASSPKTVVFGLRNFPAPEFSAPILRLHVWSAKPFSPQEWVQNVGELYVGPLD